MTTPITGQGLNVCIPPDDELSLTSKKAAQNKVITEELTDLSNAIDQLDTDKADVITETRNGYVVVIPDGKRNGKLLSFKGSLIVNMTNAGIAKYINDRNLIDFNAVTNRYSLDTETGEAYYSAGYSVTDYLDISGVNNLVACMLHRYASGFSPKVCFYDDAKAFISGYAFSTNQFVLIPLTVPSGAKYARVTSVYGSIIKSKDYNRYYVGDSSGITVENIVFGLTGSAGWEYDFVAGTLKDPTTETVYAIPKTTLKLDYGGQTIGTYVTNESNEITYQADTKLYIDQLTMPDEDMVANDNIASGQYFSVNNNLYKATAAIAQGASIVPGTNCTVTNIAEALNALNT